MKALATVAKKRKSIHEEVYKKNILCINRVELIEDIKQCVEVHAINKGKNDDGSEYMTIKLIVE